MPKITITCTEKNIFETKALAKAFFVSSPEAFPEHTQKLFGSYATQLVQYAAQQNFVGDAGSTLTLPVERDGKMDTIILLGLGAKQGKDGVSVENYRRAVGSLIRLAENLKIHSLAVQLPENIVTSVTPEYLAEQTALIATMAVYKYDELITKKTGPREFTLELCIGKLIVKK